MLCVNTKFPSAKVHVSEIIPRKSAGMGDMAKRTNSLMRNHRWQHPNITLISHQSITTSHLIDEKHLAYRYNGNDTKRMSGTMWLAGDFFESILELKPTHQSLLYARLRKSDIYPSG